MGTWNGKTQTRQNIQRKHLCQSLTNMWRTRTSKLNKIMVTWKIAEYLIKPLCNWRCGNGWERHGKVHIASQQGSGKKKDSKYHYCPLEGLTQKTWPQYILIARREASITLWCHSWCEDGMFWFMRKHHSRRHWLMCQIAETRPYPLTIALYSGPLFRRNENICQHNNYYKYHSGFLCNSQNMDRLQMTIRQITAWSYIISIYRTEEKLFSQA